MARAFITWMDFGWHILDALFDRLHVVLAMMIGWLFFMAFGLVAALLLILCGIERVIMRRLAPSWMVSEQDVDSYMRDLNKSRHKLPTKDNLARGNKNVS